VNFKQLTDKIKRFLESDTSAIIGKILKRVLQVGIIGYLVYELTKLGWTKFFESLPTNPIFYILFCINYFLLPFSEVLSYSRSWDISVKSSISVFLKKRVFNKDVMGYSGEVQLFAWARNHLNLSKKEIFKVIRDNNILSSIATTLIAFILLIVFFSTGQISLLDYIKSENIVTYISIGIIVTIVIGVLYHYRRFFFSMEKKTAFSVFSIHTIRFVIVNILQVVMWYVVMPEIPIRVWLTYLSMTLILSRIPFLPNKELVFIGASVEVSKLINVSTAGIAGLFIAQNVLDKILNAILFSVLSTKEPEALKDDSESTNLNSENDSRE
jgi:hypothetical protein